MHDRDKLHSEPGLYIMDNVLNGWGDGILGHERGVHNNAKAFHLKIGLVQGFEGTPIIKVMVKWDGKVGVHDGSDKSGMFSWGRKQVEMMTVDRDIDREDGGNFYHRQRGRCNYRRQNRQKG